MKVIIEKMDHLGRGIAYIDNKVCFVPFTIPGDEVEIEITKNVKNYMEGIVTKVFKTSRKKAFCPYFGICGGCQLQYFSYEESINYKKERIKNILRNFIKDEILFISNDNPICYRNKIELKIKDGNLGFYENKSHKIIPISSCMITKKAINNFFVDIKKMKLQNADVTVRANYNDELLISIKSEEEPLLHLEEYPSKKVVGIILNDKVIYGENHFMEKVGRYFFDVSYDAFFQVNSFINKKLFDVIEKHTMGKRVLDLYSGVGTLAVVTSQNAEHVYGIEIIPSAVLNAIKNAKINHKDNIDFLLGDVKDKIKFIKDDIDMIIVDPPRKGLDKSVIGEIKNIKPNKMIYISCDTQSLLRDLKELTELYDVQKVYAFDMFSYTYHVECLCVLNRR